MLIHHNVVGQFSFYMTIKNTYTLEVSRLWNELTSLFGFLTTFNGSAEKSLTKIEPIRRSRKQCSVCAKEWQNQIPIAIVSIYENIQYTEEMLTVWVRKRC